MLPIYGVQQMGKLQKKEELLQYPGTHTWLTEEPCCVPLVGACLREICLMHDSSSHAGNVGDMLYGASLMPNLLLLDASDQALSGQLSAVSLPTVQVLDLSNNSIQVQSQPKVHLGVLLRRKAGPRSICQLSSLKSTVAYIWARAFLRVQSKP